MNGVPKKPHIALVHPSSVPAAAFADFEKEVSADGLELIIAAEDHGPFAGVEEWLPPLVALLIASPYFAGFLSAAGKSHYGHLEVGIKNLWRSLFGPDAPEVTVTSTAGKVERGHEYSRLFGIYAEVPTREEFKLLLPEKIGQEEFEEQIAAYLAFLAAYQSGTLPSEMAAKVARARAMGRLKLVAFNRSTGQIEPLYIRDE